MSYYRQRQLDQTKKWIKAFKAEVEYWKTAIRPDLPPLLIKASYEQAESMVEDLEEQLAQMEREREIWYKGYSEADYGPVE